MALSWDCDFAERSPMLEPLRAAARMLRAGHWPDCAALNRALDACARRPVSGGGEPLRFVGHEARRAAFEDRYEQRIFLRGEVQLRSGNWHDLLNALVWLTFPAAKAALNARQYAELVRQRASGAPNRGPVQDALTLFDEGGVIVATSDASLAALLRDREWKELFWRRRGQAASRMRFYLFGHALCEKALQPFTGVTGRGVLVEVTASFLASPLALQLANLDARVAAQIADPWRFAAPGELVPVPVLGVPGWFAGNENEEYYEDAHYFRPARLNGAQ